MNANDLLHMYTPRRRSVKTLTEKSSIEEIWDTFTVAQKGALSTFVMDLQNAMVVKENGTILINHDKIEHPLHLPGNKYQKELVYYIVGAICNEEAKFEAERVQVLAEMKAFAEPDDRPWDGTTKHHQIMYNTKSDTFGIWDRYQSKDTGYYFETWNKARECIETVGGDRIKKYYFRIKED